MRLTDEELEKINKWQSNLKMIAGDMLVKIENGITEEYYDGEPIDLIQSYERLRKEIKELELKKYNHWKARKESDE